MRSTVALSQDEIRDSFARPVCRVYADTANYGLPPRATTLALKDALTQWEEGSADWMSAWDPAGDECRSLIAPITGAAEPEISLLPAVSVGVGLVAASLTSGDEVVTPDDEFRSILLPLLAAATGRGATVRRVAFSALADEVRPSTTWVATSPVRSNGGEVQDLRAVSEAARRHGARLLVDATHSAGVLPIDATELGLDVVVFAAYKHLLCPRGVAFMRTDPSLWQALAPFNASWRSTRSPYTSFYGGTLAELADDASRFDVSLAWHPWVGARESLRFLTSVQRSQIQAHTVDLASRLAEKFGLRPTGSSIVGIPTNGMLEDAKEILRRASIAASFPAGQIRLSFHVYNDESDLDYIADVLSPFVTSLSERTP
jgi:selenocysteine lyase/cysteine desulfurase